MKQTKRSQQTERSLQKAQIGRIQQMERCLDRASQAVMHLSAALDEYAASQDALRLLSDYYGSELWKQDFAADSAGLLPQDLKRDVLSEDAIWNLLEDNRELQERMQNME
ncbi:MAG: DUF4298 domain-containing protein [Bacteroidaceae bacterium]|nr:DUF4298 domain-containing protein [Bacteroidaceae bacterium]